MCIFKITVANTQSSLKHLVSASPFLVYCKWVKLLLGKRLWLWVWLKDTETFQAACFFVFCEFYNVLVKSLARWGAENINTTCGKQHREDNTITMTWTKELPDIIIKIFLLFYIQQCTAFSHFLALQSNNIYTYFERNQNLT